MPKETAEEWAKRFFEFELCPECGKDKEDHDIIKFLGNWFARCKTKEKVEFTDLEKFVTSKQEREDLKNLSVFDKHSLKIARDTLKMPDAIANIMGGPTKQEAKEIIKKLT